MLRRTALALSLAAVGCGGAPPAPPVSEAPPPPPPAVLEATDLVLAEGVTLMESVCAEGRAEACNALDDDCDGAIDEGAPEEACAGTPAGELTVALAWSGTADLDLFVIGPGAEARMAGEASCAAGPRLERRAIAAPAAGAWSVEVRMASACGATAPTTASLTVAHAGRVLGTFNRTVPPAGAAEVVRFALAPRD